AGIRFRDLRAGEGHAADDAPSGRQHVRRGRGRKGAGTVRRIWDDAVRTLGGAPGATDLMERYAEPHRAYHNTFHVASVVRDSGTLAATFAFTGEERAILTLAACAHDVIYE